MPYTASENISNWIEGVLTGTAAPSVQLSSKVAGEDLTLDRLVTTRKYKWTKLTASALVFGSAGVVTPGIYAGMLVTSAGTAGTIAVYDSDAADGTGTELPAPAVTAGAQSWFHADITTGLSVVLGGSVAPTVWVAYEIGA